MRGKDQIISFKADEALVEALHRLPNRSAFIRAAILSALDGPCPLCHGAGVLSAAQRQHWHDLQDSHSIETCDDCNESHLVCNVAEVS